jgi:hypothetical protein
MMNIDELNSQLLAQASLNPEKEEELYKLFFDKANGNAELIARAAIRELHKQVAIVGALTKYLKVYEAHQLRVEAILEKLAEISHPRKRERGRPQKKVLLEGTGLRQFASTTESIRVTRLANKRLGVTRGRKPKLPWGFGRKDHAILAIARGTGRTAKELALKHLEVIGITPCNELHPEMLIGLQKEISHLLRIGFLK